MYIECSIQSNMVVVITVVITEKISEDKASTSVLNYSSSSNPVAIIRRDGKPMLVRWTSSDLDSNSRTELMMPDSSVGVSDS